MATVAEYYAGKNIFITGATGFIGKCLIEKLLRCCPRINAMYCLVRPKKGQSGKERLDEMLQEKLYDNIRLQDPDFTDKIRVIHGDVLEEELGISEIDRQFLAEHTNIVFHSAATIRFDEPLRLAVQMNILGVRKMIKLVKTFKHLEVFLHVSTAYANCDRQYIEEMVYPSPVEPQKVIDAIEWMDDEMIDAVTPKLIGDKPNTYTYTKQLAETLLMEEGGDLPLAIVRPSIVTAAWREPLPGWIDNWNGPSGLYIAAGKGLLRSMIADSQVVADLIPVDLPVNMMITAVWRTAVKKQLENATIYQITTGNLNPFTWGEIEDVVIGYFKKNPLDAAYRRPKVRILTQNSYVHDLWVLVSHLIPAYACDAGYVLMGKKPRMVKIYNKLHKAMRILEYFTIRSWEWTHDNSDLLKQDLNPEDQKTFYFDPRALHWPTYMENYCLGTKKYILKEDLAGLPAARAHLKKLRNIRYVFNTMVLVALWRALIANSNLARNSWFFIMGLVFKFVRFFRLTSTIQRS